ncbi:MAG: putative HTH-type transcriptional regulator [Actinomycetia bacterium]|nr:putative HTH-type transcriptional regulator [Actinomycetes bacterium]
MASTAEVIDALDEIAAARRDFVHCEFEEAVERAGSVLGRAGLPAQLYQSAEMISMIGMVNGRDTFHARSRATEMLAGDESHAYNETDLIGARTTMAFAARDEGRVSEALEMLRGITWSINTPSRDGRNIFARMGLAAMLTSVGDFDEAERLIVQSEVEVELTGDGMWAAAPDIARARLLLARGNLDGAVVHAELGRIIASGLGNEFFVLVTDCVRALIALQRGDVVEAAERLDRAASHLPSNPPQYPVSYMRARARLAAARGDPAGALRALTPSDSGERPRDWLVVDLAVDAGWCVRTALAANAPLQAEGIVVRSEVAAAHSPGQPAVVAAALHARGLFERDPELLSRAAATGVHGWQRASAAEDAGVILAERRRTADAGTAFARAARAYDGSGAVRDAERVRARARDLTPVRRTPHKARPRWGWTSLTGTEHEVALNVAEGLTNVRVARRMFLSRHTVDFHLRQIYRKLGIRSRVELTRLVIEHDATTRDGTVRLSSPAP